MRSLDRPARLAAVLLILLAFAPTRRVSAQEKAAGVFDDDPKKPADAKPPGTAKPSAAAERDSIGFTQENVAAQMTELEERMFRLSEALHSLEPENSSRLRLALKFSREELILQQMKETQKLLKDAQVGKAETEARLLLAKLEHLRNLLLAEDLDFQMKLARLRQMREALAQLDRIIKEEKRELAWSRNAVDQQKELEQLKDRQAGLEKLVADQKGVVGDTKDATGKEAKAAVGKREGAVRKAADGLASDPLFAKQQPPFLKQADTPLGDALTYLETPDSEAAIKSEGQALDLFQKELDRLKGRTEGAKKAVVAEEFQRNERDQTRNRAATDSLAEVSARLGDTGVPLQKNLIRAGASMQSAEGDLAKTAAKPATVDQTEALKHLAQSRDGLAKAIEGLLTTLRGELQARIIADLTEMHDLQAAIRETTQAQAPRVAKRSRTALLQVMALAQKEAELGEKTEQLLALVEETEFGIALPTALKVIARQMRTVQGWLKEGDASPRTVKLEKRIEDDLLGLLEAMKRLPPTTPPPPGSPLPSDLAARERELNRLIAELKMIRLLQARLNDDTVDTDKSRPPTAVLTPALRREIEALGGNQVEIRDSLSKIAERLEPPADDPVPAVLRDLIDR